MKLQGVDLRIAEVRKEIATLPKQIAAIEKTIEGHQRRLDGDQAVLSGAQKERKQIDADIQAQRQKITKLRDQMLEAKTNEQYRAFQNEIDFCEQAIRKHEDRIIELMMETEALEQNVRKAEESLKRERAVVESDKIKARERTALDEKKLNEFLAERAEVAQSVTKPILLTYDRLSKKYNGLAVSEATRGRCTACQLELRPQLFQELRRGDKILFCENCRRFLYYNPPMDFDTVTGAPAPADPNGSGHGKRVDMS